MILENSFEIDSLIRHSMESNNGHFRPEDLWRIDNPYDVFKRMTELGLRVYTYKKSDSRNKFAILNNPVEILTNYVSACQYNKNKLENNYLQELFLTTWTKGRCYFSKIGENTICHLHSFRIIFKAFPGDYIIQVGIEDNVFIVLNQKTFEEQFMLVEKN